MKTTRKQKNDIIFVICMEDNYNIHPISFQMISKAYELKCAGNCEIYALIPPNVQNIKYMERYGVDRIIQCPALKDLESLYFGKLLETIISTYHPNLLLVPDYDNWRFSAAFAASSYGLGIVADCIDIERNMNSGYLFKRTAYANSAVAEIVGKDTSTVICIIKSNCFVSTKYGHSIKKPENDILLIKHYSDPNVYIDNTTCVNNVKEAFDLTRKRKIIIGIGRGVYKEDVFRLEKIARQLGAGIGYSRAAVEKGIGVPNLQIGQSGQFINADLYIAFGISGSSHHVCALNGCKKIIAINCDPNASILDYSDWGMISDTGNVIRALENRMF